MDEAGLVVEVESRVRRAFWVMWTRTLVVVAECRSAAPETVVESSDRSKTVFISAVEHEH